MNKTMNCREREQWRRQIKERDELIDYANRRADIAERRRDKDRRQRAEKIREIYAWAVLILAAGMAIPWGQYAFAQFAAWASGR